MLIIHGENQTSSRQFLIEKIDKFRDSGFEIITFSGSELTLTQLKQAIESNSLWSTDRLIVLESCFAKSSKDIIEYLSNNQSCNLFIWEASTLKATDAKKFTKSEIKEFKLSTRLFEFLDSIGLNNEKTSQILHELIQTEDQELIFIMTHKRIRQLVYLSSGGETALSKVEKVAPWQIAKLKRQINNYSATDLKNLYQKFLKFDYDRKMGRTGFDCQQFIELNLVHIT